MMNAATFNAYLDMVGISHKTAAKECSVDRQTIKRWCLGEYDIPNAIEKWILDKVKIYGFPDVETLKAATMLSAYGTDGNGPLPHNLNCETRCLRQKKLQYGHEYLRTRNRNRKMQKRP